MSICVKVILHAKNCDCKAIFEPHFCVVWFAKTSYSRVLHTREKFTNTLMYRIFQTSAKYLRLKNLFYILKNSFAFLLILVHTNQSRYFYMWDKLLCNCGNAMTFHFILVFSIVSIAFIYFHYIESIFVRGIQLCIPFIRSR